MSAFPTPGQAIEEASFAILAARVDLSGLGPLARAVVARMIHASADLTYADTVIAAEHHLAAGVAALAAGAPVVTDVEMVRHGITGVEARCYLAEAGDGPVPGLTRSAAAMVLAATHHPEGAVVVVGCAPTALGAVVRLAAAGDLRPALVIGLPVGFVGAAVAKEALRASGLPSLTNVGDKGGSAVAAAAVNALVRAARS
ncbi:MAG: precorrin-8X methylmutase [Acidimicrobiales bacterium]